MYNGKVHLERSDERTLIELRRLIKMNGGSKQIGHDFVYERKNYRRSTENNYNIISHLSFRTPERDQPVQIFNLKTDFTRAHDLSQAKLESTLDVLLVTRDPPVHERIQVDYARESTRKNNEVQRLISPEAKLKLQIKTKSNVFNFLLDHQHKKDLSKLQKGLILIYF